MPLDNVVTFPEAQDPQEKADALLVRAATWMDMVFEERVPEMRGKETAEAGRQAVARYIREQQERTSKAVRSVWLDAVNDYRDGEKGFGVDAVSLTLRMNALEGLSSEEVRDREMQAMQPRLGVGRGIPAWTRKDRVWGIFPVGGENIGGEHVIVVDGNMPARTFMPGEPTGDERIPKTLWTPGTSVTIPSGCKVGLALSVVDQKLLRKSGVEFRCVVTSDIADERPGYVWLCEYLTPQGVEEILRMGSST